MRTSCVGLGLLLSVWACLSLGCQPRCIDACPMGIARCAAGGVEVCGTSAATGCTDWLYSQCRPGEVCSLQEGRCAPPVTGGKCLNKQHSRRCNGQAVHWFDDCGQVAALIEQCPAGKTCAQGQCGGGKTCQDACQAGQTRCQGQGWVSYCGASPQTQCLVWGPPQVCPGNLRCLNDTCPNGPCQNTCQLGQRRCLGNAVQTCERQGQCLEWGLAAACNAGQSCVAGQCQGSGGQCPASCNNHTQCAIPACGTRNQCVGGQCGTGQTQCPASCSTSSQCAVSACGTRSECRQGTCQAPQAQCPASCSTASECAIPACGTRSDCRGGTCQAPQAQCPASCTNKSQCAVPACGTKTDCVSSLCAVPSQITAAEQDLFDALNRARKANGLPPVAIDMKLMCAARTHAKDVGSTGTCGHVGSDKSWPWDRAQRCGFPQQKWTVNEIAAGPGFRDGDDAVSGWRVSSGHWAAIVHNQAKTVGVAVHKSCYIAVFDCCVKGSD